MRYKLKLADGDVLITNDQSDLFAVQQILTSLTNHDFQHSAGSVGILDGLASLSVGNLAQDVNLHVAGLQLVESVLSGNQVATSVVVGSGDSSAISIGPLIVGAGGLGDASGGQQVSSVHLASVLSVVDNAIDGEVIVATNNSGVGDNGDLGGAVLDGNIIDIGAVVDLGKLTGQVLNQSGGAGSILTNVINGVSSGNSVSIGLDLVPQSNDLGQGGDIAVSDQALSDIDDVQDVAVVIVDDDQLIADLQIPNSLFNRVEAAGALANGVDVNLILVEVIVGGAFQINLDVVALVDVVVGVRQQRR